MNCPSCGYDLTGRAKTPRFCPKCKTRLGNATTTALELATRSGSRPLTAEVIVESPSEKFCDNCGSKVSATAAFCEHCGTKFTGQPPPARDAAWFRQAAKAPSLRVSTGKGSARPTWAETSRDWRATCPVCKNTHYAWAFACSTCDNPSYEYVLECHESYMERVKIVKYTVYLACPNDENTTSSLACPTCFSRDIKMRHIEVYRKSDHDIYAYLLVLGGLVVGFFLTVAVILAFNHWSSVYIGIALSYVVYRIAYAKMPRPKKWVAYVD